MTDNISSEHYKAEIAALNHEIYQLTRRLDQQERERIFASGIKSGDPFANPTEYHEYNGDYTRVLPQIAAPDYEIPLDPGYDERRRLRRSYSIGGWCLLFQFAATNALAYGLIALISWILMTMNSGWTTSDAYSYMHGSSILMGINLLIYLAANVTFALLGLKWSRTDTSTLIKTRDFTFGKAIGYCLIALFLRIIAAYASSVTENIFAKYGYSTDVSDMDGIAETSLGFAVMVLYTCIIAPVTEELFFRGMLLRVFSKASQRFAVFATAVFFGIVHGNLPQFLLAFLVGLFLAHITLKHGSIVPSIIVHMFLNTFSTVLGRVLDGAGQAEMLIMSLTIMLMTAVGMIVFLFFRSREKIPATTPAQSRRGFAVARTSIPFVAAFTLETAYMVLLLLSNRVN